MSTPDLAQIGAEMEDLGLLIGLLTGTKDDLQIDKDWFSNPEDGLKAGFNWPHLLPVIKSHLGSVVHPADGMDHDFKEKWFPVKLGDGKGGTKLSGFHVVQKEVGSLALIGVGLHKTLVYKDKKVTIDPFVFVPLIEMPNSAGTAATVGPAKKGPVEVGFKLTYCSTFSTFLPYDTILFAVSFEFGEKKVKPTIIFELLNSSTGAKNTDTDKNVALNTVLRLPEMKAFLKKPILKDNKHVTVTWAQLLLTLGWIKEGPKQYLVDEIKMPKVPDALLEYVKKMLEDAFTEFMGTNQVVNLIEKKGKRSTDPAWKIGLIIEGGRYGINVQATNIVVSQSPLVKLQIGALTSQKVDWLRASGGGSMPDTKGINFFVLQNQAAQGAPPDIKLKPRLELVSVGFDISKKNGQPLFDVKGYSLKQAQLRGYFSSIKKNKWGVGAAFNEIALPLGPPSDGTGVAQTLLASGNKAPEKEGEKKPVVNPEFSVLVAYQKKFFLKLFSKSGAPKNLVIIPIQKSFGPVSLKNIGLGWKNAPPGARQDVGYLMFGLSGGLNLNALKLNLDRLTVGVPIKSPSKPETFKLGLEGFDLTFNSGAVNMAGGFLKYTNPKTNQAEYNGAVAIQASKWGITAMGSFSSVDEKPSLFIFGVLDAVLGGPPLFFVTGAAVGFGYNRKVIMPAIDQVQNFPFVKAAVNPGLFKDKGNADVLESMSTFIPPELGQYWFAAGVKFSSFEILNSFALLILQFGKKFEVDVLGLTTLQLPKMYADSALKPYVNAQMAIKATFEPEEGLLAVQAQLTENSFVIHPECKITGGFAYYSWFNGEHAGDFVVTLGGYNKNFDLSTRSHYPMVPRLAFNWEVSSNINFSGEAYFALTPSCVMAGGKLDLTYSDGDLQAWFKAVADFLISWRPFHYDIGIGITVGVSYRVCIAFIHKTITLELGVDVQLWGPEFGGEAQVRLWIISFTVNFGKGKEVYEKSISWQEFYDYFLIDKPKTDKVQGGAELPALGKTREIITINTNAGLKDKVTTDGKEYWVVDPGLFEFNAVSVFPVSTIKFVEGDKDHTGKEFGAQPIGNITFTKESSLFTLGLNTVDGERITPYSLKGWKTVPKTENVPQAMYGTYKDPTEKPDAKVMKNITKGLAEVAPPVHVPKGPVKFDQLNLAYTPNTKPAYPLNPNARLTEIELDSDGSLERIETINHPIQKAKREAIFAALADLNAVVTGDADMSIMAQQPANIFQGSPMLAKPGAQAKPLQLRQRQAAGGRTTLRRDTVLTTGHQLKATIIKYGFGHGGQSGVIMRGSLHHTAASQNFYKGASTLNTFSISPGMLQVWQLDNVPGGERLSHAGAFPLRMVLFDEYLQVISDKILSTIGTNLEIIPAHASRMCLQGLSSPNATLLGWHEESCLALVNPKYLMGKGCLLRPKLSHSVGKKQYRHDTGLVTGRALVMNNFGTKKDEQPGWIETRFLTGIKQVFVLAKPLPETANSAPGFDNQVKLIYTNAQGNKATLELTPQHTGQNNGEYWASFTVPGVVGNNHFSIWAATQSAGDMELAGVAGSESALPGWSAELSSQLKAHDAGLTKSNAQNKLSVSLQNASNF